MMMTSGRHCTHLLMTDRSGYLINAMDWSHDEKKELLTNILKMGGNSSTKSYKTVEASLKWEDVKLNGRSVEECRSMYQSLICKVTKYRTMQEIINDALTLVADPRQVALDEIYFRAASSEEVNVGMDKITSTDDLTTYINEVTSIENLSVIGLDMNMLGKLEVTQSDFCGPDEDAIASLPASPVDIQLKEVESSHNGHCSKFNLPESVKHHPFSATVPAQKRTSVNKGFNKERRKSQQMVIDNEYITKQRLNDVNELVNVMDYQIITSNVNVTQNISHVTSRTRNGGHMLENEVLTVGKTIQQISSSTALKRKMQAGSNKCTAVKIHKCSVCGVGLCGVSNLKAHLRTHTGEKPFKCDICGLDFNRNEQLKRHRRTHTGEKPYQCDVCGIAFNRIEQRQRHKRKHTGEKPYTCDVCGLHFAVSGSLTSHKRRHTGEKPYHCDICDVRFSQKCSLNAHKRIHTGEKPYSCDICGLAFTHLTKLKSHRRKHTGETVKCEICGVELCGMGSLKLHKVIHSGEKPFKCDICGLQFTQKGNLQTHKRIHTGERPYQCDICGVDFTDSGGLQKHRRTHTGERPFKCDICGAAFIGSTTLKNHRRIHTGERPYKCDICGGAFTHSSRLKEHKRKHTGEKPYGCDVCGSGFATSGTLKQHKRTHTGEKPYKCPVCGLDFSHKEQLKRHNKVHSESMSFCRTAMSDFHVSSTTARTIVSFMQSMRVFVLNIVHYNYFFFTIYIMSNTVYLIL